MEQNNYIDLVNEAKQRSYEYYVLSAPTISDAEFDALVDRIELAEQEHPEWTLADSPTQCVGSDVSNNGRRLVRHRTRMLSCQKAQTTDAVTKWMNTTEKKLKEQHLQYALEWKLDGISCSLVYQNGTLVSAATRGEKGMMGQDLMDHVGMMATVPQTIEADGRVEVRGEIVCKKANLSQLGYKDCRTAASSLCNQVTASTECKLLDFVAWQVDDDTDDTRTECISMSKAERMGFLTSLICITGHDSVVGLLEQYDSERESLPYPVDGVVIKVDYKQLAKSLGATEHHPKGNIAYKFCVQKAVTRVINIEVKVGETGRRTPVAYLEPVTILGREVSSASLGSERVAAELGVVVGCMVEVGLSNDITPKIYRVVEGGLIASEEILNDFEDHNDQLTGVNCNMTQTEPLTAAYQEQPQRIQTCRQSRQRKTRQQPRMPRYEGRAESVALALDRPTPMIDMQAILKFLGVLAAVCVVLFILYNTGLLIPLGLIGLGIGGLLK
jgi:DNA ligase (NAD+)